MRDLSSKAEANPEGGMGSDAPWLPLQGSLGNPDCCVQPLQSRAGARGTNLKAHRQRKYQTE